MDIPSNPSHAVISWKERKGLKLSPQADTAACNSGTMSGKKTVQGPSPLLLDSFVKTTNVTDLGNGASGNHNGSTDVAGNATGSRVEPFDPQRAYPSDACIFVAK